MRITNNYMTSNMVNSIQKNMARVARSQEQLASESRLLRPSDDPNVLGQFLGIKGNLIYNEQYQRNLDDGLSYMGMNDAVLGTTGDLLTKAYEFAVQGANGTYEEDNRKSIAEQIDRAIDQLVDLGNSSVGTKYIFAGSNSGAPPFKRIGDEIFFTGFMDDVVREVAAHTEYPINVHGISTDPDVPGTFGAGTKLPAGTAPPPLDTYTGDVYKVDAGVFQALFDFRDRLRANDQAGMQTSIGELQKVSDQVMQKRVFVGARYSHFDALSDQLLDQNIKLEGSLGIISDTDKPKLSIEVADQIVTYQASLAIGSQILKSSLLDFLR
ncbi:flagellar hook-associated protein FlgL [Desulforamulus aeronauticus]|uniref:Flagellar hook-associated protein 3 FlgL n=1 Tax=Desulforamulus aeronauticus DSM 10349 TaxID=1121421 RepID=A0A1M6RE00_9FIRM|nr:flagellar hook-associated protein FlgL [Desulforamulus aeronauticus]SHK30715.1 flagellar hook-associated protein 3 FlgL [Desulforamulus aeronauticus DSM 10349]